jgi:hypothetical protein
VLSIAESVVKDFVSLNGIGFQGVQIFPFIEWIGQVVLLHCLSWVPGWIGWTEAPVSTLAWGALDGVDYKMTALNRLEYQDKSVGGV